MLNIYNIIKNTLNNINIITLIMVCIFSIPILVGLIRPLTNDRIHRSLGSLLSNLILLVSIILSVFLTGLILSSDTILTKLYEIIPALQSAVESQSYWVNIILIIILFLIIDGILHLLTIPVYKYAFRPMSNRMASSVNSMNGFSRRIIGGLWRLPKSILLVLLFSILLNFYTGFTSSSPITEYANNSAPYQLVQENVIQPLLNSTTVKNIQVILNNSFKTAENEFDDASGKYLVKYFNGVTLSEAVQSNSAIDATAIKIVSSETDDRKKAYLIYKWISGHITYDNEKARIIATNSSGVSSGAIAAYNARTGICFDYSCLYVAMCRAVDLKVRFLTGLGYTGSEWGDHAWNQVYDSKEDNWINVDTTFGSAGVNYFDKATFFVDHRNGIVQGEW